jgi:hypothetical protein
VPKLSPEQLLTLAAQPLAKRTIARTPELGPNTPGTITLADVRTPSDRSLDSTITQAEYNRRMIQAAAIMFAESGGDTDARCFNINGPDGRPTCSATGPAGPRGVDRGVWQWNSKAHPEITDLAAFDPDVATEFAYIKSNAYTTFGPWSKSRGMDKASPAYKTVAAAFEGTLGTVVDDTPGGAFVDNLGSNLVGWADALGRLLSNLISPAFWRRIGIGVLGSSLIVAAVLVIARGSLGAGLGLPINPPTSKD